MQKSTPKKKNRISQDIKEGRVAGAWLVERAPYVMLDEYVTRTTNGQTEAARRWGSAWNALHTALGVMADDPNVRAALKELDGAYGDSAVEHEDRAWFAAWTVATSLKGGA